MKRGRGLAGLLVAVALLVSTPAGARPPQKPFTLSIVGTSDLHGRLEVLPAFGGYLANLRRARARQGDGGGAVLLVDAGDMFQGTIASNLAEGAPVVKAYGALGYAAVAVGNHEFDFGPVGVAPTAGRPGDDPRGALKARAAEAPFPFLAANLIDSATGAPPAPPWPNVRPTALVTVGGLKVGLVGVTTAATARTTLAANFVGLATRPLAPAIAEAARALRRQGATIVVAMAHAGGECKSFDDPTRWRLRGGRRDLPGRPDAAGRPGRRDRRRPHPPGDRARRRGDTDRRNRSRTAAPSAGSTPRSIRPPVG